MNKTTIQRLFLTGIPYFLIVFGVTALFVNDQVQKGHFIFYAFVVFGMAVTIDRGVAGWLLAIGVQGALATGVVATTLPAIFSTMALFGFIMLLVGGKLDFLQQSSFWTVLIFNCATFAVLVVTETASMDLRKASRVDQADIDAGRERNFEYLCTKWRDATPYERWARYRNVSWCEEYVGRLAPKIDHEATASTQAAGSESLWK